jgi:hypothetical protein
MGCRPWTGCAHLFVVVVVVVVVSTAALIAFGGAQYRGSHARTHSRTHELTHSRERNRNVLARWIHEKETK